MSGFELPKLDPERVIATRQMYLFRPYGHPDTLCSDGEMWKTKYKRGEWIEWSNKPWQKDFHDAGAWAIERAMFTGNGCGKSIDCAYEVALHLTGWYPDWWKGRRFDKPILAWVNARSNDAQREYTQPSLIGPDLSTGLGTGMIPLHLFGKKMVRTRQAGLPDVADTVLVRRHDGKGISTLRFKCHPAGSMVMRPDGSWTPIEKMRLGDDVLCADGLIRVVDQVHHYESAPILKIKTKAGEISGTPNHPVFTENRGKIRMDQVKVGDILQIAAPEFEHRTRSTKPDWLVCMTAAIIGDGCVSSTNTPLFTSASETMLNEIRAMLPWHLKLMNRGPSAQKIDYRISSGLLRRNALKDSLEEDGLWGKKADSKFIPEWIFRSPRETRILFLRWLWSCDGTVRKDRTSYTSCSRKLANDVRLLLWGIGIRASVTKVAERNYYVGLSGENRVLFDEIGKIGSENHGQFNPRVKISSVVTAIEDVGNGRVFGIGIPDVHELIVEGFRVGNTYEMGYEAQTGGRPQVVWNDEEPDDFKIYTEGLTRILRNDGIMLVSLTPMKGETELTMHFMRQSLKNVFWIGASWDDVPHLTSKMKAHLMESYPEHERDGRIMGVPMMGVGRIFTTPEESLLVTPHELPSYFYYLKGIDFGIDHPAAVIEIAVDMDKDVVYVVRDWRGKVEDIYEHAKAINSFDPWVPVAWPHDGVNRDKSGNQLSRLYRDAGVKMLGIQACMKRDKLGPQPLEPIIQEVQARAASGRLKIFSSCANFREEYRNYHRDDNGKPSCIHEDVLKSFFYALMMKRYAANKSWTEVKQNMPASPTVSVR